MHWSAPTSHRTEALPRTSVDGERTRIVAAEDALKAYWERRKAWDLEKACDYLRLDPLMHIQESPHDWWESIGALVQDLATKIVENSDYPSVHRCRLILSAAHEKCLYHQQRYSELGWHLLIACDEHITTILRTIQSWCPLEYEALTLVQQRMRISYATSRERLKPGSHGIETIREALSGMQWLEKQGSIDSRFLDRMTGVGGINTLILLLEHSDGSEQEQEYRAWTLACRLCWYIWPASQKAEWETLIAQIDVDQAPSQVLHVLDSILRYRWTHLKKINHERIAIRAVERMNTNRATDAIHTSLLLKIATVALTGRRTEQLWEGPYGHERALNILTGYIDDTTIDRPTGISLVHLRTLRALFIATHLWDNVLPPDTFCQDIFLLEQATFWKGLPQEWAAGGHQEREHINTRVEHFIAQAESCPYASQRETVQIVNLIAWILYGGQIRRGLASFLQYGEQHIDEMIRSISGEIMAFWHHNPEHQSISADFWTLVEEIDQALDRIATKYFYGYCTMHLTSFSSLAHRRWWVDDTEDTAHYPLPIIGVHHPVTHENLEIEVTADPSALQFLIPMFARLKSQRVFEVISDSLGKLFAQRFSRFDMDTGRLRIDEAHKLATSLWKEEGMAREHITISNLGAIMNGIRWGEKKDYTYKKIQSRVAQILQECLQESWVQDGKLIVGASGSRIVLLAEKEMGLLLKQISSCVTRKLEAPIPIEEEPPRHHLLPPTSEKPSRIESRYRLRLDKTRTQNPAITPEIHDLIQRAIEENRLEMYLQPIRGYTSSNETNQFEMLLRINDQSGNVMRVDIEHIIQVATDIGRIEDISHFVTSECFTMLQKYPDLELSCNVRLDDFHDDTIKRLFEDHKDICSRLTVEISEEETGLDVKTRMLALRALYGVKIAIDDYCKGQASFSRLPGEEEVPLKFDKALSRENIFFTPAPTEEWRRQQERMRQRAIDQIIMEIRHAKASNSYVVIEGIESSEELEIIANLIRERSLNNSANISAKHWDTILTRHLRWQGYADGGKPGKKEEMIERFYRWRVSPSEAKTISLSPRDSAG